LKGGLIGLLKERNKDILFRYKHIRIGYQKN